AAIVPVHHVVYAPQRLESWDSEEGTASGLQEVLEVSQRRRVVLEVFEDVQHQHEVVLPRRCVIGPKSSQLDALTPLRTRIHQGWARSEPIPLAILAKIEKADPAGATNVEDVSFRRWRLVSMKELRDGAHHQFVPHSPPPVAPPQVCIDGAIRLLHRVSLTLRR